MHRLAVQFAVRFSQYCVLRLPRPFQTPSFIPTGSLFDARRKTVLTRHVQPPSRRQADRARRSDLSSAPLNRVSRMPLSHVRSHACRRAQTRRRRSGICRICRLSKRIGMGVMRGYLFARGDARLRKNRADTVFCLIFRARTRKNPRISHAAESCRRWPHRGEVDPREATSSRLAQAQAQYRLFTRSKHAACANRARAARLHPAPPPPRRRIPPLRRCDEPR